MDGVRILDEREVRPGRVRIKAAFRTELPEGATFTLERTCDEWRIASERSDGAYVPKAAGLSDPA